MRKDIYFGDFSGPYWPEPHLLAPYFAEPTGDGWPREGGNDEWGLGAGGLYGTDTLPDKDDQVTVELAMTGYPNLGVILHYAKWDGRTKQKFDYASQGDLRRLQEIVVSMQGTPMSVGLFVPYAKAFEAVKEFIEADGELPTSIKWGEGADIPPEAFFHPGKLTR